MYRDAASILDEHDRAVGAILIGESLLAQCDRRADQICDPHHTERWRAMREIQDDYPEIWRQLDRAREVLVHTDSSYTIGVLSKGWKAKKNVELIAKTRALVAGFANLKFQWVPGHSGVVENERCDELARAAVKRRS